MFEGFQASNMKIADLCIYASSPARTKFSLVAVAVAVVAVAVAALVAYTPLSLLLSSILILVAFLAVDFADLTHLHNTFHCRVSRSTGSCSPSNSKSNYRDTLTLLYCS